MTNQKTCRLRLTNIMSNSEIDPAEFLEINPESSISRASSVCLSKNRRNLSSWIYAHCSRISQKGVDKNKCNYCSKTYVLDATTGLSNHLKKHHANKVKKSDSFCSNWSIESWLEDGSITKAFSDDSFRERLCKLFVNCHLPLSVVESKEFRLLCQTLRPNVKLISRHTLLRDINSFYLEHKSILTSELNQNNSKLSLTCDSWTSKNQIPFFGVTAHFIDENFVLKSNLLAVSYLGGTHSGENLADFLFSILSDFHLENKFLAITTDNASNNDSMMTFIGKKINNSFLENSMRHIRCVSHIINLTVKAFLKECKINTHDLSEIELDVDSSVENRILSSSLIIDKISIIVRKIRKSPQQIDKFKEACGSAGIIFKMPVIDVCTRWNSTFEMLNHAYEYKHAYQLHGVLNNWPSNFMLNPNEWEILKPILEFLKFFKECTLVGSKSLFISVVEYIYILENLKLHVKNFRTWAIENKLICIEKGCLGALSKLQSYSSKINAIPLIATMLDPRKKRRFFEIVWKEEHDYLRKLNDLDSLFFVIFSKYDTNATCAPCEPLDLKINEAKTSFTKLFSWNEDEMENRRLKDI